MSTDPLEDSLPAVTDCQAPLDELQERYARRGRTSANGHVPPVGSAEDDAALLNKLFQEQDGSRWEQLYRGEWQKLGYPSQSEADQALCSKLAFYYGGDAGRIDSVFRRSGLMREKWERADYRDLTIGNAVASCCDYYHPKAEKPPPHGDEDAPPAVRGVNKDVAGPGAQTGAEPVAQSAQTSEGRPAAGGEGGREGTVPGRAREEVTPYPLEALPGPLARLAREAAVAFPCPPDFVAVPALTICGAAIGRSRALQVKPGWLEGPRLWSGLVADPGQKKSPVLALVQRPLERRQRLMLETYREQFATFEADKARYDIEMTVWTQETKKAVQEGGELPGGRPEKPAEPQMPQLFTTDSTTEALGELLAQNARGVILVRDELTGWARSMDQYHSGKGGDRQAWLSFWAGAAILLNRKGRKQPLYLTNPFVAVTGCLPPDVLTELADDRGREDGFVHRLLFSFPEPVTIQWTDACVSGETFSAYERLVETLAELEPAKDTHGNDVPQVVNFTGDGRSAWVKWVDEHYREMADPLFPDGLRGPWAKMDGYAASVALIVQTIRFANGEAGEDVDALSVQAAAAIIGYHKVHARRVYPFLRATEEDRKSMNALKWIERQEGHTTTARELLRHHVAGVKHMGEAKKLLRELEERGYGETTEEPRNSLRFTFF